MKLTDFFGKKIYSLYEGEVVGTIYGATFNKNYSKIKAFKLFDEDENEFELMLKDVYAMSENVIIANRSKFTPSLFLETPLMQKLVLDKDAKTLGKIIDIEITPNGEILSFLTKQQRLAPKNLYIRNDFIYHSTDKISINKLRPKNKSLINTDIKVKILYQNNENIAPTKLIFNPINLIGKRVKQDLLGINNEIIIKANQPITEKTISDATLHNRLNQLFYIAV